IESALEPELCPVIGDATQLHQVLLNLCVNARDAMPDGGRLRLRAAKLEVSDTGPGIPPEILERIFEPFFTTKGVGKGTGLGLSTVHGIVKSHGGFITVKTGRGEGTTFQVYFPASSEPDTAEVEPAATTLPNGKGELVLVVDDEAKVRDVAGIALQSSGYQVLLASDGAEALAMFATSLGKVAVVLTDLNMPFMDGVAL